MTEEKVATISQAKFLVGVMELQKSLRDLVKQAGVDIRGGSKPTDVVPDEWIEAYQKAVLDATHKVCNSEFTHEMAMKELGDRISEVLTKGLDDLINRVKERKKA